MDEKVEILWWAIILLHTILELYAKITIFVGLEVFVLVYVFFPGEEIHSFQQMIKVSGPKQRLEPLFEQWHKRHLSTQRQGGLLPQTYCFNYQAFVLNQTSFVRANQCPSLPPVLDTGKGSSFPRSSVVAIVQPISHFPWNFLVITKIKKTTTLYILINLTLKPETSQLTSNFVSVFT